MANITKSRIIKLVLQKLINKIGRRTSEVFATATIETILNDLLHKYDFLKFVKIQNTSYSEGIAAVIVASEIDTIESTIFYKSIKDIIEITIKRIGETADFFFIKEFQDSLDKIKGLNLTDRNIDLSLMQNQYIANRKKDRFIEKSNVVENVIKALVNLLNNISSEGKTFNKIVTSINNLKKKYDFLKFVEIDKNPQDNALIEVRVRPEINNTNSTIIAEVIQKLIEDLGKSMGSEKGEIFIEKFKIELGNEDLSKLIGMGINLEHVKIVIFRQEHESLIKKTVDTLIEMISKNSNEYLAISIIDASIEELKEKHDVLKYITIDKSQFGKKTDIINISPDINNVVSYKIGKAIRDIIKTVGNESDIETSSYINEFKNDIGEEYLHRIKKIGVNLHFLELKFSENF